MASYRWGVVCQQAIIDKQTNLVSYINIIEQLTPPEYPAEAPRFTIATLWDRDEKGESFTVRVRAEDKNGKILQEEQGEEVEFEDFERFRINRVMGGFEIGEPGCVRFQIDLLQEGEEWETVGSLPVMFMSPEEAPESDSSPAE
jgi:hypothetical protein